MKSASIVVIGAGFAGAATAFHLALRGREVLILEQEDQLGVHSSGRSAAMIRQVVSDEEIGQLAKDGAAFARSSPGFRCSGSLLAARGAVWRRLRGDALAAARRGVPAVRLDPATARRTCPLLKGARFDGAILTPDDGVMDALAFLKVYLKDAEVRTGCRVLSIETRNGRVTELKTNRGRIRAETVVDAAGAWAGGVACSAGLDPIPLRPCRRHIFFTGPLPWVDPGWPFVWFVGAEIYARPDAGGLLLSPCDQTDHPPGLPPVDPKMRREIVRIAARSMPALAGLPLRDGQAGLRTLTPDGRFAIGSDPRLRGFFWVAGLGGHGVTTSHAVGRLAAEAILNGDRGGPFDPARRL